MSSTDPYPHLPPMLREIRIGQHEPATPGAFLASPFNLKGGALGMPEGVTPATARYATQRAWKMVRLEAADSAQEGRGRQRATMIWAGAEHKPYVLYGLGTWGSALTAQVGFVAGGVTLGTSFPVPQHADPALVLRDVMALMDPERRDATWAEVCAATDDSLTGTRMREAALVLAHLSGVLLRKFCITTGFPVAMIGDLIAATVPHMFAEPEG